MADIKERYRQIYLENIRSEGVEIGGHRYVRLDQDSPLVELPTLAAVRDLWDQFDIGDSFGDLPKLENGWEAISIGGDECKLIAVYHGSESPIAIKRYWGEDLAALVFNGFQVVAPVVRKNNFPLLLPFARYGDTLLFPFLEIEENQETREGVEKFKKLLAGLSTPLRAAARLRKFILKGGSYQFSDPFDDSQPSLQEILDSLWKRFSAT